MKVKSLALALGISFSVLLTPLAAPAQPAPKQTNLKVYNSSNNAVEVYITLDPNPPDVGQNPGFIDDVYNLNFQPPVNLCVSGGGGGKGIIVQGIPQGGQLQGHFTLQGGTTTMITVPGGSALNGNISFGKPPSICPDYCAPNGINVAEFRLDNNFSPFPSDAREYVDISCVHGVNAEMMMSLNATPGGPWSYNANGNPVVTSFSNKPLGSRPVSPNLNQVGVFSVGCDGCTSSNDPGCKPWSGWDVNKPNKNVCRISRNSRKSGGLVTIWFQRFYPTPVPEKPEES